MIDDVWPVRVPVRTDGQGDDDRHDGSGDHSHDHHEHDVAHLSAAVLTVSSTRDIDQDPAGDAIEAALTSAGHEIAIRELVRDDYDGVQSTVGRLADRRDVDCLVTTGGTGVSPDDVTIDAVRPLFDRELPGFGELFRQLSREEIGTRVVATRATAGIVSETLVCCLPGSEQAARLGAEDIVAPVAAHLVGLARR